MSEFKLQMAGRVVNCVALFDSVGTYCKAYQAAGETDFSVVITPLDIAHEREKSAREGVLEGKMVREYSDAYLEILVLQRNIVEKLFNFDTLLFHGSVVAIDGNAYLFTAKSGTGKSTHTRLWREVFGDRAVMVNDDKPFLEIRENQVIAHGSPWNGKHRLGQNISLPLRSICILERGETNEIHPITPAQALPMLMQQSQRPQDRRKLPLYMDLIDRLSSRVSFYRMRCNMDPQAARMSYEAMCPKETIEMENHNED